NHADAVAVVGGTLLERQRRAIHDNVRTDVVPALVTNRPHAARNALPDPEIIAVPEQMGVAADNFVRDFGHLLRRHADVDPQVSEGAIEPIDMLLHLERTAIEGPRHVEAAIAVDEAPVAIWHADVRFGNISAVEVGHSLIRTLRHHASSLHTLLHL